MGELRPKPRIREGRCYELSYKYLLSDDFRDWQLVHGEGQPEEPFDGPRIGHSWLERKDEVFDPVRDKTFVKDEYYNRFKVTIFGKWTIEEAAKQAVEARHFGPWA